MRREGAVLSEDAVAAAAEGTGKERRVVELACGMELSACLKVTEQAAAERQEPTVDQVLSEDAHDLVAVLPLSHALTDSDDFTGAVRDGDDLRERVSLRRSFRSRLDSRWFRMVQGKCRWRSANGVE